jgi:hypothetical protein
MGDHLYGCDLRLLINCRNLADMARREMIIKAIVNGIVLFYLGSGQTIYMKSGDIYNGITLVEVGPDWVRLSDGKRLGMFYQSVSAVPSPRKETQRARLVKRPKKPSGHDFNKINYGLTSEVLNKWNKDICRAEPSWTGTMKDCMDRQQRFDKIHDEWVLRAKTHKKKKKT